MAESKQRSRVGLPGTGHLYRPRYKRRGDAPGEPYVESSVWWWRPPGGKAPRVSTRCRDRRDAEAWAIQRLAEMGRGSMVGFEAQALTFEAMAEMIRTQYGTRAKKASLQSLNPALKHLAKSFGGWRARDITSDRVTAHAARRLREGAAIATVNVELTRLKRCFSLAVEARRFDHIPKIRLLEGATVRMGTIADEVLAAVVAQMPDHMRPVIEFLRLVGWRESEALGLEWSRVWWATREVVLDIDKAGNARTLPFHAEPRLEALLKQQWQDRVDLSPWVFPGRTRGRPIGRQKLQRAWARARVKAGFPGILIHDLRRTVAAELIDAGVSELDAMLITGHKTLNMFRRYALRSRQAKERALARVSEYRSSKLGESAQKFLPFARR